jgi:hypothetical protein
VVAEVAAKAVARKIGVGMEQPHSLTSVKAPSKTGGGVQA